MKHTYRCSGCGTAFTATRRRCTVCGRVGHGDDREDCWDCESLLDDAARQRCPACGSTDVQEMAVVDRE